MLFNYEQHTTIFSNTIENNVCLKSFECTMSITGSLFEL